MGRGDVLHGPRVDLRPLKASDWEAWRDVRVRSRDWLEPWEPLGEPGAPDPVTRRRRVQGAVRRVGAPASLRCRVRVRDLPAQGPVHRRGEPRERPARPVPVGQRRLLDRRAATPVTGTCPRRSPSCCGSRSSSSGCTASRRRSSRATRAAGASRRSSGMRDEGTSERFLQIRGVWEDHVALRDHRRGVGGAQGRARGRVPRRAADAPAAARQRWPPPCANVRLLARELGLDGRLEVGVPRRLAQRRLHRRGEVARERGTRGGELDRVVEQLRRRATLRHTSPSSAARAASTRSPNSVIAAAACGPTSRSSIQTWPPPGWSPIRAKRASNRAEAPAIRTSQQSARLKPAPTAGPFTAATVGRRAVADREEAVVDRANVETASRPLIDFERAHVGARAERRRRPGDDERADGRRRPRTRRRRRRSRRRAPGSARCGGRDRRG